MAKHKQQAAAVPQNSQAAAIPDVAAGVALPAAAPSSGWIDLNKPMSIEEMYRTSAIESPFLACNF